MRVRDGRSAEYVDMVQAESEEIFESREAFIGRPADRNPLDEFVRDFDRVARFFLGMMLHVILALHVYSKVFELRWQMIDRRVLHAGKMGDHAGNHAGGRARETVWIDHV